jgi:4-hydroxy-tetrahydrodipicolinate synthase
VAGTTGEAPVLSDAEKLDLFSAVRGAVTVPIVAGTGSNDTRHTVELTRRATERDVDGVLVVTPYYSRPGPVGIEAHFRAAAEATDRPVLIYDIPVRTGRKVSTDLLLRLGRDVPNIVGVKDAAGDLAESASLVARAPAGFELYSGDDALTLPLLSIGGVGLIGVATHWSGPQHREMVAAHAAGDVALAREINASLLESFAYETGPDYPNPIPAKAMLRTLGLRVGECRLPLGAAPPELSDRARTVYADLTS